MEMSTNQIYRSSTKNKALAICEKPYFKPMPEKGLEPPRYCYQWILSPPRLPFRHSGLLAYNTAFMRVLSSINFSWKWITKTYLASPEPMPFILSNTSSTSFDTLPFFISLMRLKIISATSSFVFECSSSIG